ncbi:MAG: GNAT family N-acetyltransferase [Chloroflexota bacterium]|nr:GNAT family N-acetyltransferase [Chloroflexota bacterium]
MTDTGLWRYLPWDSDFFGYRIGRIGPTRLLPEMLTQILREGEAAGIECLYLLADPADVSTVRQAEDAAFRLVDLRVTLKTGVARSAPQQEPQQNTIIRPVRFADIPALRAIAAVSYRDSRFYYDGHFSHERCAALYAQWIEQSCREAAAGVLVAERDARVVGYISCGRQGTRAGQIGLVGVATEAQGLGIGSRLMIEAMRWFAAQEIEQVTVVTQGRNTQAQRLYQRHGFLTHSVELWYHRWAGHQPNE